jgi:phospholipid transport system substrate-binding protein
MNRILKNLSLALMLAGAPGLLMLDAAPVRAQAADPAVDQIQGFYDALVASMKSGGTTKSRYDRLKPAIDKAFDLQAMTATAIGPSWATASDADKKALTDAFTRMTIANYAKNFDSYGGEKFTVEPASIARGSDHFVKSTMKTSTDTIAFNYRMHQVGSDWKITDVLLAGSISQMAQKRSDFAATLAASGPQGLAKRMNALTDQMLG